MPSGERAGIIAAVVSSDPVMLAVFRFGLGFLLLLPLVLLRGSRWPRGRDWLSS